MASIAFVFPGQGSQKVGMGKELVDRYPEAGIVFESADRILGRSISDLCYDGPADLLTLTSNAQPAIFVVSAAILSVLRARGIHPSFVAGHSLGELTAYYAAGVIDFETTLKIIEARGRGMSESVPAGQSGMAAVMGMDASLLEQLLQPYSTQPVVIANLNCPGQIVVSGEKVALDNAIIDIKAAGAKVIPLPVSGAFHSPMMAPGSRALADYVKPIEFKSAGIPVVLNRTAQPETRCDVLKSNLPLQVVSPVRWIETIEYLQDSVGAVVEVGPGKVLTGLVKKIAPELPVQTINDGASLSEWLDSVEPH